MRNKDLLYFQMQMLQVEIEMNAMIAENKFQELNGNNILYDYDSFMNLIEKYKIYHNAFPFRDEE
jgi:hypothetical protein